MKLLKLIAGDITVEVLCVSTNQLLTPLRIPFNVSNDKVTLCDTSLKKENLCYFFVYVFSFHLSFKFVNNCVKDGDMKVICVIH